MPCSGQPNFAVQNRPTILSFDEGYYAPMMDPDGNPTGNHIQQTTDVHGLPAPFFVDDFGNPIHQTVVEGIVWFVNGLNGNFIQKMLDYHGLPIWNPPPPPHAQVPPQSWMQNNGVPANFGQHMWTQNNVPVAAPTRTQASEKQDWLSDTYTTTYKVEEILFDEEPAKHVLGEEGVRPKEDYVGADVEYLKQGSQVLHQGTEFIVLGVEREATGPLHERKILAIELCFLDDLSSRLKIEDFSNLKMLRIAKICGIVLGAFYGKGGANTKAIGKQTCSRGRMYGLGSGRKEYTWVWSQNLGIEMESRKRVQFTISYNPKADHHKAMRMARKCSNPKADHHKAKSMARKYFKDMFDAHYPAEMAEGMMKKLDDLTEYKINGRKVQDDTITTDTNINTSTGSKEVFTNRRKSASKNLRAVKPLQKFTKPSHNVPKGRMLNENQNNFISSNLTDVSTEVSEAEAVSPHENTRDDDVNCADMPRWADGSWWPIINDDDL